MSEADKKATDFPITKKDVPGFVRVPSFEDLQREQFAKEDAAAAKAAAAKPAPAKKGA
jgi:hypothetical protein